MSAAPVYAVVRFLSGLTVSLALPAQSRAQAEFDAFRFTTLAGVAGSGINSADGRGATKLAGCFSAVGAIPFSSDRRDAALVATLEGGRGYTVQVAGADGAGGDALLEIYEIR